MLGVLRLHMPALLELGDPRIKRALAIRFYRVSSLAFKIQSPDLGRQALREARSLGLVGHPGSVLHRVSSTMLGLELKTRLATTIGRLLAQASCQTKRHRERAQAQRVAAG